MCLFEIIYVDLRSKALKRILKSWHYSNDLVLLGLFKNIHCAGSNIIKEDMLNAESTKIKKVHEMFMSLKESRPLLCLEWIQLVFLFGFDDEDWWATLQGWYEQGDSSEMNIQPAVMHCTVC